MALRCHSTGTTRLSMLFIYFSLRSSSSSNSSSSSSCCCCSSSSSSSSSSSCCCCSSSNSSSSSSSGSNSKLLLLSLSLPQQRLHNIALYYLHFLDNNKLFCSIFLTHGGATFTFPLRRSHSAHQHVLSSPPPHA